MGQCQTRFIDFIFENMHGPLNIRHVQCSVGCPVSMWDSAVPPFFCTPPTPPPPSLTLILLELLTIFNILRETDHVNFYSKLLKLQFVWDVERLTGSQKWMNFRKTFNRLLALI